MRQEFFYHSFLMRKGRTKKKMQASIFGWELMAVVLRFLNLLRTRMSNSLRYRSRRCFSRPACDPVLNPSDPSLALWA